MGQFGQFAALPLATDDLFADLPPAAAPRTVVLAGPTDLDGFRLAARRLLGQQIPPGQVHWCVADAAGDISPMAEHLAEPAPAVAVPAEFVELCKTVILHSDPGRFALLYRLLWRLVHEPGLRLNPLDADRVQAGQLAEAVHRDMHQMKAFVRFRSIEDESFKNNPQDGPLHVAWFEPEHFIVEAVAPVFARRFTQMRWALVTPQCSVEWEGVRPRNRAAMSPPSAQAALALEGGGPGALRFGPAAPKEDAPGPDASDQRWLSYYQHIFNPARLKPKM